jgi:hypothetical protein
MKNKTLNLVVIRHFLYAALCAALFSQTVFSQKTMNEQRAIKERHIDFTKEYIFFTIHGLIEIDGHTFKNDTSKCPIRFQANLDGISIIDTCAKVKFKHRICRHTNCKIIHLEKQEESILNIQPPWNYPRYFMTPTGGSLNLNVSDTLSIVR